MMDIEVTSYDVPRGAQVHECLASEGYMISHESILLRLVDWEVHAKKRPTKSIQKAYHYQAAVAAMFFFHYHP